MEKQKEIGIDIKQINNHAKNNKRMPSGEASSIGKPTAELDLYTTTIVLEHPMKTDAQTIGLAWLN